MAVSNRLCPLEPPNGLLYPQVCVHFLAAAPSLPLSKAWQPGALFGRVQSFLLSVWRSTAAIFGLQQYYSRTGKEGGGQPVTYRLHFSKVFFFQSFLLSSPFILSFLDVDFLVLF